MNEPALKNLLNNAVKEIMAAVDAEGGSLFLFDSGAKELVLDSFYNSAAVNFCGLKQKIGEGISGKVAAIKTPILVKDIKTDFRFQRNGFTHYKTNSFISIPLFTVRGLFGLINLTDKSSGESFSQGDFQAAVAMSKYMCMAIENMVQLAELKQEKELSEKQKLSLEKYASVGKLAAEIVHEINNPLDGVIRYVNMSVQQAEENSVTKEYLLEAKKGLSRIANITKSLLEFSHQIKFKNAANFKDYADLSRLIDECLDAAGHKRNGNTRIIKKYRQGLPQVLDFGLSHVLVNLINNALDAMPAAGVLTISTDIIEEALEIQVCDNGAGIPFDIRERIFEPFFTTKSMDKGTGLGLAICNEIVKKYDGKIDVQSSLGEGSTFIVRIPSRHLKNG